MLTKEYEYNNLKAWKENQWLCTLKMFSSVYKEVSKSKNLESCCKYFGIKINNIRLHTAIYDTRLVNFCSQ